MINVSLIIGVLIIDISKFESIKENCIFESMDTQLIYGYLATLKTGYCKTTDEYRLKVIKEEITFRASFTQYMIETDGKGANLILSDLEELYGTLSDCVKNDRNNPFIEQFKISQIKTKEAIAYIKRTVKMYANGDASQSTTNMLNCERLASQEERVISGLEGLKNFLGCGKNLACAIAENGILIEHGIQYKVGNCWKFNAKKLEEFIEIHPKFLENIHCKR